MNLLTPVDIKRSARCITYDDKIVTLGSCFSDNMAAKMQTYFLPVEANPFGTLYNPVSIAHHIDEVPVQNASVVIITWGTSWVYVDNEKASNKKNWMDAVVDNCQKRPASCFTRRRLSVEEIVELWRPIVENNADKRFIFTVSPIRHVKDGLHENQISKAILLEAVDRLGVEYFPSYEIMLDELRDYRFYAQDMMHPNATAVDYIWERFSAAYLHDAEVQKQMQTLHQLWLDMHHRPMNEQSAEWQEFRLRTEQKYQQMKQIYPWI